MVPKMNVKILLIVIVCTFLLKSADSCDRRRKSYHVYYDRYVDFLGAWSACHSFGQRLATITSEDDARLLKQAIAKTARTSIFYVAGYDTGYNGKWVWFPSNTEITGYSNWYTGLPDLHGERCLEIGRFGGITWNDISCCTHLHYICEESLTFSDSFEIMDPGPNLVKRYYVHYDKHVDFLGAWNACLRYGQRLATVTSQEKANLLQETLDKVQRKSIYYIAGIDTNGDNKNWVWVSRNNAKVAGYTNWHLGQPDNVYDRCIEVGRYGKWTWNDVNCCTPLYYICED
ncbi:macrophage mannose receptor 1-like [Culex pipiens pallens]|uniref:macrophage mannose receptor 1-like n=1 Tax=Culex pipiens pallens TaxID=42434 RepID=UPI001954CD27|nr:macrophage mannose receptor 1-like [Culex pipiens pallens]